MNLKPSTAQSTQRTHKARLVAMRGSGQPTVTRPSPTDGYNYQICTASSPPIDGKGIRCVSL